MITWDTSTLPLTQASLLQPSFGSLSLSKLSAHPWYTLPLWYYGAGFLLNPRGCPLPVLSATILPHPVPFFADSIISAPLPKPALLCSAPVFYRVASVICPVPHELMRSSPVDTGWQPRQCGAIDLIWWKRWWSLGEFPGSLTSKSRLRQPDRFIWRTLKRNCVSTSQSWSPRTPRVQPPLLAASLASSNANLFGDAKLSLILNSSLWFEYLWRWFLYFRIFNTILRIIADL